MLKTAKPARQRVDLLERTSTAGRVDAAAGVIRGVRIIGKVSKNGREYSDAALRQAVPMYEGTKVYLDHPSHPGQSRSIRDRVGVLENCRMDGDCVRGDLRLLKAHPMTGAILEAAETQPTRFGLSHHASGESIQRGGKMIVESILSVRSVDLVENPATNSGLFESCDMNNATLARQTSLIQETIKDVFADQSISAGMKQRLLLEVMDGAPLHGSGNLKTEETPDGTKRLCDDLLALITKPNETKDQKLAAFSDFLDHYEAGFYDDPNGPPRGALAMAESYADALRDDRASGRRAVNVMEGASELTQRLTGHPIPGTRHAKERESAVELMIRRYR